MSELLRSTTFQLEFNGADGITGIRTFTKAVTDADAVVAELSKVLGENVTVTAKNVKSKAELARQAQTVVREFERSAKQTENLTKQYNFLASTIGKTSDEIEQMNAVARLGSNASEAQKKQVLDSVIAYQQLRDSVGGANGANGSLRDFRGVMQNAGWQVQDTIVQLQMGTSAFMVLSQQGSQFAAAFGPTGAVVGAVIALAGVLGGSLYTSLTGGASEMEKLKKITEEYGKIVTVSADGTTKLSDEMESLAKYSGLAADQQLRLARIDVFKAQAESIKVATSAIEDFNYGMFTMGDIGEMAKDLGMLPSEFLELKDSLVALNSGVTEDKLKRYAEAISKITPEVANADEGSAELLKTLMNQFHEMSKGLKIIQDTSSGWKGLSEDAVDSIDAIVKAFEAEYNALTKQTESVDQEYNRRKKIIDDYVAYNKGADEKAKEAYSNLDLWKEQQLDKEFQTFYKNLVKKTNTVDEEYDRQKKIIDEHVKLVGSVDKQAAEAYIDLEKWKTDQYQKEYDKRERVRREIERAQIKQKKGDDPIGAENDVFAANMQKLDEQRKALAEGQLKERQRINALMEGEMVRHKDVMAELELEQTQNQLALVSMAAQQLTTVADLMATGANDVKERVREMNDFQKGMFIVSQAIAAAMAFVNGVALGTELAKMFPLAAPEMIALGTGIGAASAGAIMGVTIAGAFDKGGNIPTGQAGIVSEYGDELVNGVLIKGPARVTSREDTAKLMNQGGGVNAVSLKVSVQNSIPNANFEVQQISAEEVKIIATQVFNKNIDSGVSRTLSNRNSQATKALKNNFDTRSKV